jgi:hypothetical protein
MTFGSASAELMEMKRTTIGRVLVLTKVESLRKLEQQWRSTINPVVV